MSPTSGTTGKSERSLFEKPRGISFRAAFFAVSPPRVPPRAAKKAHKVCRPGRDKLSMNMESSKGGFAAEKCREAQSFVAAATRIVPPRAAKGFNWACAKLPAMCAVSRFAKPRSFLKKVLIVAVRSCHCGVLIRGLRNLGTSCERNVFRTFRVYEKYQKYTRGLRTSGLRGRFKALSEETSQKFPAAHIETGFARKTAAKRL